MARVTVFDDGDIPVVLIVLDQFYATQALTKALREAVAGSTPMLPEHVVVTAHPQRTRRPRDGPGVGRPALRGRCLRPRRRTRLVRASRGAPGHRRDRGPGHQRAPQDAGRRARRDPHPGGCPRRDHRRPHRLDRLPRDGARAADHLVVTRLPGGGLRQPRGLGRRHRDVPPGLRRRHQSRCLEAGLGRRVAHRGDRGRRLPASAARRSGPPARADDRVAVPRRALPRAGPQSVPPRGTEPYRARQGPRRRRPGSSPDAAYPPVRTATPSPGRVSGSRTSAPATATSSAASKPSTGSPSR